jgi:D-alanine-D-alanine ligase
MILHGRVEANGPPDELDVLVEVETVSAALERLGHGCRPLSFSLNLEAVAACLGSMRPDVVFNLVEAVDGAGRLIHLAPALLDHLHIPSSGSPTAAIWLTSNKLLAKRWLAAAGIPTPPWHSVHELLAGAVRSSGPFLLKSVWEHASIGLDEHSLFRLDGVLPAALEARARQSPDSWFVERYVEGREFNVSLIAAADGLEILPVAEIEFIDHPAGQPKIVGYRAKWEHDSPEYRSTRRTFAFPAGDRPLLDRLGVLARACWELFGLRGYGRVDFRVDEEGRPWVLEVNTNPCIAPDSGFVAAAEQRGLSVDALVAHILRRARTDGS